MPDFDPKTSPTKAPLRRLMAASLGLAAVFAPMGMNAQQATSPSISLFGTPGFIDNPSGELLPDGQIALTFGGLGGVLRSTATFQIAPRLIGSFRYAAHGPGLWDYINYDRSFDFAYQVLSESARLPSLTFGMRDFAGTGRYSSEYFVATKHLTPALTVSGGLAWGRLGGDTRAKLIGGDAIHTYKNWFTGSLGFFGGARWQVNDRLAVVGEYSNDTYALETTDYGFDRRSPWNFGATYQLHDWNLGLYYAYGSEIGFRATYQLNPMTPRIMGGRDNAPPLVAHRDGVVDSWGLSWTSDQAQLDSTRTRLTDALEQQGMVLEGVTLEGTRATIWVRNRRFGANTQAVGRAARVMTQVLPASVEVLTVVPVVNGVETTAVTVKRTDMETLEWAANGSHDMRGRAVFEDGIAFTLPPQDRVPGVYPDFSYKFSPYFSPSLFDPDAPIRADFGVQLEASYTPRPGLIFSGQIRQPLVGNLNTNTRVSDSVLPHVRSDAAEYDRQTGLELSHLTAEYFFRPRANVYGRVTVGYLERMYGGISAEVLWAPDARKFALGAELNYVAQRDFDVGLGFQDYRVATGHVSAYYRLNDRYQAQIDAGRYLAGDWGATFRVERRFQNDWRVGVFATLTDVPFDTFGEGAFDKGIYFNVPHSWLTGDPSRKGYSNTIHVISRDGGARLDVRNRLYDTVSGFEEPHLSDRWGRFWR